MRMLISGALVAAMLLPTAAFADEALFEASDWRRLSERRLDRVLGDYDPASTRPAVKIGEVSMAMDDSGVLTNPQMTRSTGEADADATLMRAAERLNALPAPPEAIDARTVLLRVAFVTPSGVAPWQENLPQRQPFVFVEQAENGSGAVVLSAVR